MMLPCPLTFGTTIRCTGEANLASVTTYSVLPTVRFTCALSTSAPLGFTPVMSTAKLPRNEGSSDGSNSTFRSANSFGNRQVASVLATTHGQLVVIRASTTLALDTFFTRSRARAPRPGLRRPISSGFGLTIRATLLSLEAGPGRLGSLALQAQGTPASARISTHRASRIEWSMIRCILRALEIISSGHPGLRICAVSRPVFKSPDSLRNFASRARCGRRSGQRERYHDSAPLSINVWSCLAAWIDALRRVCLS